MIDALADYATEERNPQNHRGLRAIDVSVPIAPERLRLLDTPGVGSLGTSASEQAFAWLPRCDFGVVLVAAGSPLGHDDFALVTGLSQAGIACRVLLSKCDLTSSDERDQALQYVKEGIMSVLGPEDRLDVIPVSTRPGFTHELDFLRHDVLEPPRTSATRAREGHTPKPSLGSRIGAGGEDSFSRSSSR